MKIFKIQRSDGLLVPEECLLPLKKKERFGTNEIT